MAQRNMDKETFSCSICLELLRDPVTLPCGHSYCMSCIQSFWDEEDGKKLQSCPECRQTFTPRPVLRKNIMLAALVEQLKTTGLQAAAAAAAAADFCYAGAEDVACDFCTGGKLKALKSCLVCLASYCEIHLQPHYESAAFKRHKLVEPSQKLQENMCSRHNEVMKMFCRTDQQCICHICVLDDQKGHDTVSAAAERSERQKEVEERRQAVQQRTQDREEDLKVLQQELKAIDVSADEAVEDGEEIIIELEQETAELQQQHNEDLSWFLQSPPSLSPDSSSIHICPPSCFEEVTAVLSETREKLQDIPSEGWTNISRLESQEDVLPSLSEPRTRAGFLKYSREITLDPNTANTRLLLSEGSRKATVMRQQQQSYSRHPERFNDYYQVLSRDGLTGRCYWEVEWRGGAFVAVAYKNISRRGDESVFGHNDKSWALNCDDQSYKFMFNSVSSAVSGPRSSRVGVYLDHSAGLLSFYSVSETMTLLHRVRTTFTQPLHAGVRIHYYGVAAEFINLK